MIYTETGKYAIRALLYLTNIAAGDVTTTAGEIAEAEDIPPYYLAKVLKDLSNVGILDSVRGRGGGFQLSRPADQISVLEVLEVAEGLSRRVEACVLGLDECSDKAPCALHDYWAEFRNTTLRTLADLSLADLLEEQRRKQLLSAS